MSIQTIPARRGKAARLQRGQSIKIINTHGHQVVDFWAIASHMQTEYAGMEHTRATLLKLCPQPGDSLYTNRRRKILTMTADTSPGRHDTLIAPCDNERYGLLGCNDYHDNCHDNFHAALAELGVTMPYTPDSLNLFMNIPWQTDGSLSFEPPLSSQGQYVEFKADMDCIAVMSACPQDILSINNNNTVEAHFEILPDPDA